MFTKNALVAAAALVASVAAQAQNINIYGNLDVSVGSFEDDLTNRITEVRSSQLTGSFIGFKGQEDLGGGLKAFFKLESDVAVDTGEAVGTRAPGTSFWNRTSELGLTGGFGGITAGNSLSLAGRTNDAQSPFSVFGNMNGIANTLGAHGAGYGLYQTNTLTYTSPVFSGFSGAAQYSTNNETPSSDKIYAVAGNYVAGPLSAGLTVTNNDINNQTLVQIGGSYDFGSAKGFAQVGQGKLTAEDELTYFQLGGSFNVAPNCKVLVAWTHGKSDDLKTDQLAAAYDHSFTKRTGAYAGLVYDRVKTTGNDSDSGLSIAAGLRHAF